MLGGSAVSQRARLVPRAPRLRACDIKPSTPAARSRRMRRSSRSRRAEASAARSARASVAASSASSAPCATRLLAGAEQARRVCGLRAPSFLEHAPGERQASRRRWRPPLDSPGRRVSGGDCASSVVRTVPARGAACARVQLLPALRFRQLPRSSPRRASARRSRASTSQLASACCGCARARRWVRASSAAASAAAMHRERCLWLQLA